MLDERRAANDIEAVITDRTDAPSAPAQGHYITRRSSEDNFRHVLT